MSAKKYPLFCERHSCGDAFEARRPDAKYCSPRCRNAAKRERDRERVDKDDVDESQPLGSIAQYVEAELKLAGRLANALGQAAVLAARRLDAAIDEPGGSFAALQREFRAARAAALHSKSGEHVPGAPSGLDEFTKRLQERQGGGRKGTGRKAPAGAVPSRTQEQSAARGAGAQGKSRARGGRQLR